MISGRGEEYNCSLLGAFVPAKAAAGSRKGSVPPFLISNKTVQQRGDLSGSALPDARVPAGVEDSQDFHPIGMGAIEHDIAEPCHDRLANITKHDPMQKRIGPDAVEDSLHSRHEIGAKPGLLRLVIIKDFVKFGLSLVAEDDGKTHCRALARARALISSQGVTA